MKKLFASAFALFAVGFAYSQSNSDVSTQVGNENDATINQTGWLNENPLDQMGNNNVATIASPVGGTKT